MLVMLRKDHPGNFHRSVFRTTGKGEKEVKERVKILEFQPAVPVDIQGEDLEAIKDDIGVFLTPVEVDEKGRPRVVNSTLSTADSGNRIAELELEVSALEEQVELLIQQVVELGGEPIVEAVEVADDETFEDTVAKPKRRRRKKAAE